MTTNQPPAPASDPGTMYPKIVTVQDGNMSIGVDLSDRGDSCLRGSNDVLPLLVAGKGDEGMIRIAQRASRDCGVAALAMVTGASYEYVRDWFGVDDLDKCGLYASGVESFLADHGFAVQKIAKYRGIRPGNQPRDPWPVVPFAGEHICHVEVYPQAPVTHWVAMDVTGFVFDPLFATKIDLREYSDVLAIYGVYRIDPLLMSNAGREMFRFPD